MAAPVSAAGGIQIKEIYYNSPGSDTGSNTSLNAEWVLIKNTAAKAISLKGWTLRDTSSHVYHFPSTYKLGAGHSVKVHTGKGPTRAATSSGEAARTSGTTTRTPRR
jgi:Lamin Tail Domain